MILKYTLNLMIISMVYSAISLDHPIHILGFLRRNLINEAWPNNFITHLGDACTLYEIKNIQSEIILSHTTQINRDRIHYFGYKHKTKIAQLFRYMNDIKYDKVGKFMYEVYTNIHNHMYYSMEYNEIELGEIESKLNENLSAIVTSNYWSENLQDLISYIPDNLYLSLFSKSKDTLHINNEMDGLRDVCHHLLSSQESVECFEKVLMNLNNIQLTPEEIQFAIMNYRTITKCDYGASSTFVDIVPLNSFIHNITHLMKKQMQNVLCLYSELLLVMYNEIYFEERNDIRANEDYLNIFFKEFVYINEYTREFTLYLHIMNNQEFNAFMDKFITFQLLFRIHFEKFLFGVEDITIENRYLKFLFEDSRRYDNSYINNNDNTLFNLNFYNNEIFTYDLRDRFRDFAILNDELCQDFEWKSVDFYSVKIINPRVSIESDMNIEDSFSLIERVNIVKFRRLVSQDLQHTLTGLMDLNGGPVLQATRSNTYNKVFTAALPSA